VSASKLTNTSVSVLGSSHALSIPGPSGSGLRVGLDDGDLLGECVSPGLNGFWVGITVGFRVGEYDGLNEGLRLVGEYVLGNNNGPGV